MQNIVNMCSAHQYNPILPFIGQMIKKTSMFNVFLKKILLRLNNAMLVLGVQQSESVLNIHICTPFQILFPYWPLQFPVLSTVGPYQLSILYIVVCICQSKSSNLSQSPLLPSNHKFVFYIYNCYCFADKYICTLLDSRYVISCDICLTV